MKSVGAWRKLSRIVGAVASMLLAVSASPAFGSKGQPSANSGALGDSDKKIEVATFAGGCFWCIEAAFEGVEGVEEAVSGYTGGHVENPTYEQVGTKKTGHYEAVRVYYDESRVSYEELLNVFWRQIDPTDKGGQFADRGPQYRAAVFVRDSAQREAANASKEALAKSGRFSSPIVTPVLDEAPFYPAEPYHQGYYEKNESSYRRYKVLSGRSSFLKSVWKEDAGQMVSKKSPGPWSKPLPAQLKEQLSPRQYAVTQKGATEPPFDNEFWDNKQEGIYVDVVSGEPLFSSADKFDSGSGWPSFTKPIEKKSVVEVEDASLGVVRTEVRSAAAGSHLGHVFDDGPGPTNERYCVNSAALRFVPRDRLVEQGYGDYLPLFE